MMEMNYNEFRYLIFYKKKDMNINYSIDTNVDGERFYEIFANEPDGGLTYFVKINSEDDPDEITDFETNFRHLCNKPVITPGMAQDVQALMIKHLEGIEEELKLLNKRMEFMIESGIGRSDLDLE